MFGPFNFEADPLSSSLSTEQARAVIDQLLAEGVDVEGVRTRLYGWRLGDRFSMSFGVPFLSGASVLRGRLESRSTGVDVVFGIGSRVEAIVLFVGIGLVAVVGAVAQLWRSLAGPLESGMTRSSAVLDVLPGIVIVVGILVFGLWGLRRRMKRDATLLTLALEAWLGPDDRSAGDDQAPSIG